MSSPGDEPSRLEAISTRWSLLRRAHGESITSAGEARSAIVLRYLPAIRRYIGALLQSDQDVDDVTHDVVVRLLSGDFAGADPARGRFRDLLKTAIRNMVRNRWAREKRRRSTGLDAAEVAHALHDPTPEKIEDEIVALGLMDLVRDLLPADRWEKPPPQV